jgi:uncharacterized protein (DUF1330 family)
MSAYFALQIEWTSDEARRSYVQGLGDMIEKHGGDFIVASKDFRVVEGSWKPGLFIVIKFPTMRALSEWYDSEEYRPVRELRLKNSHSDAVIVEGD